MFNAKIRKEIQRKRNVHLIRCNNHGAFFVCHSIEYKISDCKIKVSFIFKVVFLNIFIASSMFNICDFSSELALEILPSI